MQLGQGSLGLLRSRLQCPLTEPPVVVSMTAHVVKKDIWRIADFRPSALLWLLFFLVSLTIVESHCTFPVSCQPRGASAKHY